MNEFIIEYINYLIKYIDQIRTKHNIQEIHDITVTYIKIYYDDIIEMKLSVMPIKWLFSYINQTDLNNYLMKFSTQLNFVINVETDITENSFTIIIKFKKYKEIPREELDMILNEIKETASCGEAAEVIHYYYYGNKFVGENLDMEYSNIIDGRTYPDYVIDRISNELNTWGFIIIFISNESGPDGDDVTFDHLFTLFRSEGKIYRIESYYGQYCGRIVELNDWKNDLYSLLIAEPGSQRLAKWNGLFSATEHTDTPFYLKVYFEQ